MSWIQKQVDLNNNAGNLIQKLKCKKLNSLASLLTYYVVERFLFEEKQKLTDLFNEYDRDLDGIIDL